jgi:hypothetical protein
VLLLLLGTIACFCVKFFRQGFMHSFRNVVTLLDLVSNKAQAWCSVVEDGFVERVDTVKK